MLKRFLTSFACMVVLFVFSSTSAVLISATEQQDLHNKLEEVAKMEESPVKVAAAPSITQNERSSYDGFDYELWTQESGDDVSMDLTGGGTFQCSWDAENALFRTGKKLGSTMNYKEYGSVTLEYSAEHTITSGDVSYLCMYGWTEDPMIEFYVIENHGNYKPPGGTGFQGEYSLDGSIYEVYVNTRVEQPSIQGTKTFQQYFSVRKDKRTKGTISVSEHFKKWEGMGLDMSGVMYEISLCVEGYRSSGSANISKHLLTVGDTVYGAPSESSQESAGDNLTAEEVEMDNSSFFSIPLIFGIIIAVVIGIGIILTIIILVIKLKRGNND